MTSELYLPEIACVLVLASSSFSKRWFLSYGFAPIPVPPAGFGGGDSSGPFHHIVVAMNFFT